MKFLVDAQLPPALVKALREAGHDAEHVEDAGLRHAKDRGIWDYALAHRQVIITKGEDFANRLLVATPNPQVVWLRVPNCSKRQLLRWLLPELPQMFDPWNTATICLKSAEHEFPTSPFSRTTPLLPLVWPE